MKNKVWRVPRYINELKYVRPYSNTPMELRWDKEFETFAEAKAYLLARMERDLANHEKKIKALRKRIRQIQAKEEESE